MNWRSAFFLVWVGFWANFLGMTVYGSQDTGELAVRRYYRTMAEPRTWFLEIDGTQYEGVLVVTEQMEVMVPEDMWKSVLGISVLEYPDSRVLMQSGAVQVNLEIGRPSMVMGQRETQLKSAPAHMEGKLYLPLQIAEEAFGYERNGQFSGFKVKVSSGFDKKVWKRFARRVRLPEQYDYRIVGRAPSVKDQGEHGTCWSSAALTALESARLPKDGEVFSVDHMSFHNSFSLDSEVGGDYIMSLAYLLAWQGPVLEEEDPYGDGVSPDGLTPSVHVKEVRILPDKDYRAVKEAVFLYGGVQSSLYSSQADGQSYSAHYKEENSAYCYDGDEPPNHDVVIVGWADDYPKENFATEAEGDGAFLCLNSWGKEFGEEGYFYVSYYDKYIGSTNVVYTEVEKADSALRIYQTDLCGWIGQIGYEEYEEAYGANVYEAKEEEQLWGAGFYAVCENTSYEVYIARNVIASQDFEKGKLMAKGTIKDSGYYTVSWEEAEVLEPGERFAVIVHLKTPGTAYPLAVEYPAGDVTETVDLTDGEGYISLDGEEWESAENMYECNLCLKAYTKIGG